MADTSIPVLDLSVVTNSSSKSRLLAELRSALFDVGFLYIVNHGVKQEVIEQLANLLPALFSLSNAQKAGLSKLNSPHFLGYSGFAEETTLGKPDLREQFDFATELPVDFTETLSASSHGTGSDQSATTNGQHTRDFSKLYWKLRGPNQWPSEGLVPAFRQAYTRYHDAVQELSYRFVNLIEEAFGIPIGTFDHFFGRRSRPEAAENGVRLSRTFLAPQHRIKLLRYPPSRSDNETGQGVGAHKDSSGWLTFLYQVGQEAGLEVLGPSGSWLPVKPIPGSFVVNFGNAFEAATEGAVKATIHRVLAPKPQSNVRYSIPFFQGLPLDMTVSEVRTYIPSHVRRMRKQIGRDEDETQSFLDARWDSLGESQLRKWIRSHRDVALKWYGREAVEYYTATD